jgi:hypothetical protein
LNVLYENAIKAHSDPSASSAVYDDPAAAVYDVAKPQNLANEPGIFVAKFDGPLGVDWSESHTFLDTTNWGHGAAMVNGFDLGRYWPLLGPQVQKLNWNI